MQALALSRVFWRVNPTDWHFLSITLRKIPVNLPSVALTVQVSGYVA